MRAGPSIDSTPAADAVQTCRTCQLPIVNDEVYGVDPPGPPTWPAAPAGTPGGPR